MNVWRLMAHHEHAEAMVKWTNKTGRIAIGWGKVGTIRNFNSAHDITLAIKERYPVLRNAGLGGVCLYDFCHRMQPGDLVILSTGKKRAGD